MKYLKKYSYYNDLYDLLTIKECIDHGRRIFRVTKKSHNEEKIDKEVALNLLYDISIYYIKGENYLKKKSTIGKWIANDKAKDELLEKCKEPSTVQCDSCETSMNMTDKDLYHDDQRILFFFECPNCKKRKGVFNTGEIYKSKKEYCPECSYYLEKNYKREGKVLTTTLSCKSCGYSEDEIWDMDKEDREYQKKEVQDKKLLEKYRHVFCLSDKQGKEYINSKYQMEYGFKFLKEQEDKRSNPAYQKAKQLKKLKVVEVKNKLEKVLKKNSYINLRFKKPEMGKYVIVPFTVEDNKSDREGRSSELELQKLIKSTLKDTNWRLMSEGTHYRLGYLEGRLKGYESEDDLIRLVNN